MRTSAWIGALVALVASACGGSTTPGQPGPGDDLPGGAAQDPGGASPIGTHEAAAVVRVSLRGLDDLGFADGTRIVIDRFVVSLGEVSLLRDLSDPAASNLDFSGTQLPILSPPGEPVVDRFIIGRENIQGGFKGIRLELSPPTAPATSPNDGPAVGSTLFVQGMFVLPSSLAIKSDGAKISPNPAPIEPQSASQALSSSYPMRFSFQSRRVQDLLVGFHNDIASARTVTLVFRANRWFTEGVRSYLVREAATRRTIGIAASVAILLPGSGYAADDPDRAQAGLELESAIVSSLGIEVE
jgi:hypothetical protein